MEQPKLREILQEKNWTSSNSLSVMKRLSSKLKDDLCTIFLDARNQEPEVLEVSADVFHGNVKVTFTEDMLVKLKKLYEILAIKSNPELMKCLRQSQEDKKNGDFRKFEDIVRECGLDL